MYRQIQPTEVRLNLRHEYNLGTGQVEATVRTKAEFASLKKFFEDGRLGAAKISEIEGPPWSAYAVFLDEGKLKIGPATNLGRAEYYDATHRTESGPLNDEVYFLHSKKVYATPPDPPTVASDDRSEDTGSIAPTVASDDRSEDTGSIAPTVASDDRSEDTGSIAPTVASDDRSEDTGSR